MSFASAKNYAASYRGNRITRRRAGFTLLELMLSLALIVVATALIGFIMQLYSRNFTEKSDDIRREQLGRAILNMIAADIRALVLEQEYDGSVLAKQLGAESGGGEAGAADSGGGDGGLASDSLTEDPTLASESEDPNAVTDPSTMLTADLPPGIYGDQSTLMLTVSRIPRRDEYLVQQASILAGSLNDAPGDIKTVQYFVQAATMSGVSDEMAMFQADPQNAVAASGFSSGLIRRALDRSVMAFAEEQGNVDSIQRTGSLIAPEVISIQFAYFDGVNGQWVYEWDSSQQSLPWLVQITLAMQSKSGANENPLPAGTPLMNLTFEDQKAYGLEVYELVVAIPGANLVAADAAAADAAAGMESVGL